MSDNIKKQEKFLNNKKLNYGITLAKNWVLNPPTLVNLIMKIVYIAVAIVFTSKQEPYVLWGTLVIQIVTLLATSTGISIAWNLGLKITAWVLCFISALFMIPLIIIFIQKSENTKNKTYNNKWYYD